MHLASSQTELPTSTCTGLMYRQYLRELTLLSELKKEQSPTNCPIKSASIVDLIMGEPAPLSNDKVAEICKEPPAETRASDLFTFKCSSCLLLFTFFLHAVKIH